MSIDFRGQHILSLEMGITLKAIVFYCLLFGSVLTNNCTGMVWSPVEQLNYFDDLGNSTYDVNLRICLMKDRDKNHTDTWTHTETISNITRPIWKSQSKLMWYGNIDIFYVCKT